MSQKEGSEEGEKERKKKRRKKITKNQVLGKSFLVKKSVTR